MSHISDIIEELPLEKLSCATVSSAAKTKFPTPMSEDAVHLSDREKMEAIAGHFSAIMETLGLDLEDESLRKTPERVAKMFVKEVFSGLSEEAFPPVTLMPNPNPDSSAMILIRDITINSFCEHHFVPIQGKAHIAYIPNESVIGLSKVNRIAQYFAKRPQIQERLIAQIADSLSLILETKSVAIVMDAKHCCVSARGVQDCASKTRTQLLLGDFKTDHCLRQEFFNATLVS